MTIFRAGAGYEVVGTASNGVEALSAIRSLKPEIAILDIRMPGKTGLEVAAEILEQRLPTRVILLTADLRDSDAMEAMRIGVHGVIVKEMATTLLLKCIEIVHAGGRWVEQDSLRRAFDHLLRREPAAPIATLTAGELRVVELLAAGARSHRSGSPTSVQYGSATASTTSAASSAMTTPNRKISATSRCPIS